MHVILKLQGCCISTMDIICQYRGKLIPLLKNGVFLGEVMHSQVAHRVMYMIFFVKGKARHLQISTTLTEKSVTHTTQNNKISCRNPTPSNFALYLYGNTRHGPMSPLQT
jgi:hypothetical protein